MATNEKKEGNNRTKSTEIDDFLKAIEAIKSVAAKLAEPDIANSLAVINDTAKAVNTIQDAVKAVALQDAVKAVALQDAVKAVALQDANSTLGLPSGFLRSMVQEEVFRAISIVQEAAKIVTSQVEDENSKTS